MILAGVASESGTGGLEPDLLREAFMHAPVGQAIVDLRDPGGVQIAAVNRALLRSIGIEDGGGDAQPAWAIGERLRPVVDAVSRHSGAGPLLSETCLRHQDGRQLRMKLHASFLREEGKLTYAILELRDAAGRDELELAPTESERYLRDIVDNVAALVYLKGLDGRYLLVNRYFEQLYRFRSEEMLGKTDYELFRPEAADHYRANDQKVLGGKEPLEVEEPGWHKDGQYLSIKFPLFDESGRPAAVGGISTDITERKRAERAATKARDEAEQANQAKSQFLSRVSHELRTPLNAILGFGQLLRRQRLAPEAAADVDRIVEAGGHLLTLINEVLEISRIEEGGQALVLEPVHACDPLGEALEFVRPLAREREVDLGSDMHAGLYRFVRADGQRLKQILLNVLANAVKYNRVGGSVRAWFELRVDRLRYLVADTGPGIDERNWELVFAPFERLNADRSEAEGTGLGLALSRSLIEAMGGAIGIARSGSEGTTFFVDVPLTEPPERMHDAVLTDRSGGEADHEELAERRVLYVEDNQSNINLVTKILGSSGRIELVPAMQGRLGIELAARSDFDLIIVDLHLPDLDGDELIRAVRADARTREIPILVLSADATPGQSERLISEGADRYLTKPLDVAGFIETVHWLLEERSRG